MKRSFLDGLIDTLASTAAAEVSERLPGATARAKATARRHLRRQFRDSMRAGVKKVAGKKPKKDLAPSVDDPGIERVQFYTACNALGLHGKCTFGERVEPELIRAAKRELAKKFHPDVAANKREQFQAVMQAAEWLEKYNAGLEKK